MESEPGKGSVFRFVLPADEPMSARAPHGSGASSKFRRMSGLPITGVFNDGYIAELYEAYRRDPASVDESWRQFFRFAEQLGRRSRRPGGVTMRSLLRKAAGAAALVGAIQRYGHLAVQLDPLGTPPPGAAELEARVPRHHRSGSSERPGVALGYDERGTAADVVRRMRDLYCGPLGYEFEHLERRGRARVVPRRRSSPARPRRR